MRLLETVFFRFMLAIVISCVIAMFIIMVGIVVDSPKSERSASYDWREVL